MADLGNLYFGIRLKDLSDKDLDEIVAKVKKRLEDNKVKMGVEFDPGTLNSLIENINRVKREAGELSKTLDKVDSKASKAAAGKNSRSNSLQSVRDDLSYARTQAMVSLPYESASYRNSMNRMREHYQQEVRFANEYEKAYKEHLRQKQKNRETDAKIERQAERESKRAQQSYLDQMDREIMERQKAQLREDKILEERRKREEKARKEEDRQKKEETRRRNREQNETARSKKNHMVELSTYDSIDYKRSMQQMRDFYRAEESVAKRREQENSRRESSRKREAQQTSALFREIKRFDHEINRIQLNKRIGLLDGDKIDQAIEKLERYREVLRSALTTGDKRGIVERIKNGDFSEAINQSRLLEREQRSINDARRRSISALLQQQQERNKLMNSYDDESRMLGQLRDQLLDVYSIYTIERFARSIIEIGGEFQKQRIALRSMLGDVAKADNMFGQIKDLAIESPFNFKDLMGFTKQIAAFGIEYDEMYDTTKRLADISAGLGVDMGRVILAYGQVRSAAVLRGQELRQFTEAGIPMVDELARKFSELEGRVVSAGEVFDKISRREVAFSMVKDVLWDLTNEGGKFFQMQEVLTESLSGKFAKLQDSYEIMLGAIAESNNELIGVSLDALTKLTNQWRILGGAILSIALSFGAYKVSMLAFNAATAIAIIKYKGLARAATVAAGRLSVAAHGANIMTMASAKMIVATERAKTSLMGLSRVSAAVSAIALVATAFVMIYRNATKLKRELSGIFVKVSEDCQDATIEFDLLVNRLDTVVKGSKEYNDIIEKIHSRYGSYLDNLKKEAYSYETLHGQIDRVTEALRNKAAEEARQQGKAAIQGHFSEDIVDATKTLEDNLIKHAGLSKGVAKAVAIRFVENVNEAIRNGEVFNTDNIISSILKSYGKNIEVNKYTMIQMGRNVMYDEVASSADMLGRILENSNNELKSFEETLSAISSSSAEKKINEIAEARRKLYEGQDPKTRKERKDFNAETIRQQLKAIEGMADAKPVQQRLNAQLGALENYGDTWVETVEKIRESIRKSKGAGDEFLQGLMPTEGQIEGGLMMEWLRSVGESAKKAKDELEDMLKIPIGLRNSEITSSINRNKDIVSFGDLLSKAFGFNLDSSSNDRNSSQKDVLLQNIRERLSLVKDAYAEYKKWADAVGKEASMAKVSESGLFGILGDKGIPTTLDEYKSKVQDIRKDLEMAIAKSATKERRDTLREALKVVLDIEYDIEKENLDRSLKAIQRHIEETAQKWDLFRAVMDKTGNRDLSYHLAFGELETAETDFMKGIRDKIGEELEGKGLSFADVIDLNEDELRQKGAATVAPLVEAYRNAQTDLRKITADSLTEIVSQYRNYADKIAEVERKKNEDIAKIESNRSGMAANGVDVNKLIANRKRSAEEEKGKIAFEEFKKTSDWAKVFGDLKRVSDATLNSMIEKIQEFSKTQQLSMEETKTLIEALEQLRSEHISRNPFDAFIKALDKVRKTRKAMEYAETDNEKKVFGDMLADDYANLNGVVKEVIGCFSSLSQSADLLGGAFENLGLGSGLSNLGSILGGAISGAGSMGMASMMLFGSAAGPWGAAAGAALGLISEIGKLHDKRIDKKIQKSAVEVKKLENAYSSLSDVIERQLGSVTESQSKEMLDNLRAQRNELIRQRQLEDEKKKTDQGKMEDYRKQIDDLGNQMKYLYEDLASEQYGASVKDWASSISDALIGAFRDGTDAAEAFDKAVADIMSDVVGNMLRLQVIEPAMKSLREYMFGQTGIFTDNSEMGTDLYIKESEGLAAQLEGLKDKVTDAKGIWDKINDLLQQQGIQLEENNKNDNSVGGGIQSITEDTANLLASYINAIRHDVSVIRMLKEKYADTPKVSIIAQAQLQQLNAIAQNTGSNVRLVQEIRDILHRNVNGANRFNI